MITQCSVGMVTGLAEALADYVPKDVGQRPRAQVESGDSMKWLLEDSTITSPSHRRCVIAAAWPC
jgi:hypothetical protein